MKNQSTKPFSIREKGESLVYEAKLRSDLPPRSSWIIKTDVDFYKISRLAAKKVPFEVKNGVLRNKINFLK